ESVVPLFGDQTYYWIFNDKGNVHSESLGQPIGMEVRAQAFAFTTNDEVNNMTFYNYVLINQGSQTLTETYFGSWVDADLGNSTDDYVGCDVQRGLGYCYNGDANDEAGPGTNGYGLNPPSVGVDFFEGPYQDADLIDNPLTSDITQAEAENGIPYSGLGIGYGDDIIDNERFGMRRFVYYNIGTNPTNGDPDNAPDYYNYMRGIWKNGQVMKYGGTGVTGTSGVTDVDAGYMFPGDTDPLNWGTDGTDMPDWSEESSGNPAGDRRFIQSAGPFTLQPGDYNNITVGVVWARSLSGDPLASVQLLRDADDKAQALFDNCFELVSGPDAPDVTVRELENELILMLGNESTISNNYNETYLEFDASIPESIVSLGLTFTPEQRSYQFEGYMVYQLLNAEVSPDELGDVTRARLIAQCDLENDITNIINYDFDSEIGLPVPSLEVSGANEGLQRSFRITEDQFATGSKTLVNHKTYYFMAIAYGYNNYLPYNTETRSGQARSFISSRKSPTGAIEVIAAIPHKPNPENGGTIQNSTYGQGIAITRIEGKG
ncbi:MAG: T9SS C-terminal target domain-containing protein, partial [Flavobacteriales bacterium]